MTHAAAAAERERWVHCGACFDCVNDQAATLIAEARARFAAA